MSSIADRRQFLITSMMRSCDCSRSVARALARRFDLKGKTVNANQARSISLRALQNARGIKSGLI